MGYGLSNFPESGYDEFSRLYDLPPSKIQDAQRYQILKAKTSLTSAESEELNSLTVELQNYIISPQRWNHMSDALRATQITFSTDVTTYFQGKQNEINNTVSTAISTIHSTKDSTLIAIEQKKENIINYMDSTTAGAIRNDLGIKGELTTTDKSSLVNAINEVNAKEVDLTPINTEINTLNEEIVAITDEINLHKDDENNPHNVTASQVGAYTTAEVDDKIGVLTDEVTTHKKEFAQHLEDNNKHAAFQSASNVSVPNGVDTTYPLNYIPAKGNSSFYELLADGRVKILETGNYLIIMGMSFDSNTNGYRRQRLRILRNNNEGAYTQQSQKAFEGEANKTSISEILTIYENEILRLEMYQTSGSTINANAHDNYLHLVKLGEQT